MLRAPKPTLLRNTKQTLLRQMGQTPLRQTEQTSLRQTEPPPLRYTERTTATTKGTATGNSRYHRLQRRREECRRLATLSVNPPLGSQEELTREPALDISVCSNSGTTTKSEVPWILIPLELSRTILTRPKLLHLQIRGSIEGRWTLRSLQRY